MTQQRKVRWVRGAIFKNLGPGIEGSNPRQMFFIPLGGKTELAAAPSPLAITVAESFFLPRLLSPPKSGTVRFPFFFHSRSEFAWWPRGDFSPSRPVQTPNRGPEGRGQSHYVNFDDSSVFFVYEHPTEDHIALMARI